jgi:hypothetical protein
MHSCCCCSMCPRILGIKYTISSSSKIKVVSNDNVSTVKLHGSI